jgi:hypothetical protein
MAIQAGDIALTWLPDSKSKAKERPVLVLEVYGLDCLVVAITSLFDADNLKPNQIRLPVNDVTNLWKESVVACDWKEVVLLDDLRAHGRVDALVLARARRIILNH